MRVKLYIYIYSFNSSSACYWTMKHWFILYNLSLYHKQYSTYKFCRMTLSRNNFMLLAPYNRNGSEQKIGMNYSKKEAVWGSETNRFVIVFISMYSEESNHHCHQHIALIDHILKYIDAIYSHHLFIKIQ